MKKYFLSALIILAFANCSHEVGTYGNYINVDELQNKSANEITKEDIQANVSTILGTVDPNQDWSMIALSSISITADADLDDIVKVQILSESPFVSADAGVLIEADVQKGQTVELTFDAPKGNKRLIAACVSSKGEYYVKSFEVGQESLSFAKKSNTRAATRASSNYPNLSDIKLEYKNSFMSYNAIRTIMSEKEKLEGKNDISFWKGSGWENERLYKPSDIINSGSDWVIEAQNIKRNIDPIDEEERAALQDIFNDFLDDDLSYTDTKKRADNIKNIRNNPLFSLHHNYLTGNGFPVIITPVQMFSTDTEKYHSILYYYYFNPQDIAGLSEQDKVQYIKNLPKFKAISCFKTRATAGIVGKVNNKEFFKVHEFLLPYYGDGNFFSPVTLDGYETDGKLYRIRNGYKLDGEDYYASYAADENQRLVKYSEGDDESLQLWQIFKRESDKSFYLYNIGTQSFMLYYDRWQTAFTANDILGAEDKPYIMVDANHFVRSENKSMYIGSDLASSKPNNGIWSDKKTSIGAMAEWYFEEYEGKNSYTIKETIQKIPASYKTAENYAIPEGYMIGFMIRKGNSDKEEENKGDCFAYYKNKDYYSTNYGEVYGDERLNMEINQFPDFKNAWDPKFNRSMKVDDPRVAIFSANKKIYMTFEDGVDCNFDDLIVEVTSGVKEVEASAQVTGQAYTYCFEDRKIGDYDLNDVVIKAERLNLTQVKYTLVACGAYDELYLRNIHGDVLNEETEVHAIFGASPNTFVNTGEEHNYPEVSEIITVDPSFTFSDPSQQVYIYNKSQGYDVRLSTEGDPDPHAIVIPTSFSYPMEKKCITTAYPLFRNWAQDANSDQDWYETPIEGEILTEE